ncbi:MAG: HAMP domain-containing histidine kinase [Acidobacteriota bacterium]|nr:HAMP domain-containing histidine kinase [Acidobacteriota bacterium]
MRSLFAKTLLWFLATMVIAIGGIILTTALTFRSPDFRQSPFNMLLRLQVEDLKRAYESGGQPALASVMARFQSITQSQFVFTDAQGTDLLTGQSRPDLQKRMGVRPRPPIPFIGRRGPIIARPDSSHKYWLFVIEERRGSFFWFLQYQHLWIVGAVVLLCYAFAYHLTSPVQRLKKTVEGFGAGDLSARAPATRNDEIGELARSFNQMAGRIQTLVSAERRLLQDISHELRSPLARLCVATELARSSQDYDQMLDRIQREADRLNELVGELIEVTRAEGDPSKKRMEPVRLDELIADLVDAISIEATARECTLDLKASQPVTVAGDEELLRRVVENVVRNAVRYAPPRTTIDVRLERISDRARITVRDYGPGVPEESLPRIFDAFYRVESDRDRASGGVGLGLAIARRAVELHKGSLEAQNANPGLMVTIDLPVTTQLEEKPLAVVSSSLSS